MKTRVLPSISLALLLLSLASGLAPRQTFGGDQVPFRGDFTTAFQSVLEYPLVHVEVAGNGKATHMGLTTATSNDQVVNLETGEVTATYYLTSANGDQLVLAIHVHATPAPGGLAISGGWHVLDGTGRFENTTGSGTLVGAAIFTGPDTGVDHFKLAGTISQPNQD